MISELSTVGPFPKELSTDLDWRGKSYPKVHIVHGMNMNPTAMRKGSRENAHHENGGVISPEKCQALFRKAEGILPHSQLLGFDLIRDAAQARRQLDVLGKLLEKYPEPRSVIEAIEFADLGRRNALALWEDGKLVLDLGFVNGMGGMPPPGVDMMGYLITHEFGHIMTDASNSFGQCVTYLQGRGGTYSMNALLKLHQRGMISEYATRSWHEAVAEGFARMEPSPDTATYIERHLHKLLGGKDES